MRQVTDIFPMKASTDQDERQKLYLLPEAIKLTRGSVADAELLLKDQQTQAFLGKRAACRHLIMHAEDHVGVIHLRASEEGVHILNIDLRFF